MGSQSFSLNWNNHKSNMSSALQQLFTAKAFVDVTIVCDGLSLKAHKMVLSASSPLFRKLLLENPCQHPIVIMTDITYSDMEALLSFMYRGEIEVTEEKLSHFLRTAEKLKIKGLSSSDSSRTLSKRSNCSERNNSQSTSHTGENYLGPAPTEPNSTDNAFGELSTQSSKSLEINNYQQATSGIKPEASIQKSEYMGSESYCNDVCLRNGSSDYSTNANQLCATEFAKSTISCLRHWEGLTSGNPSYIENQNSNENSNVQQEVSSGKENIPMVTDEDNLQDQIFPPPFIQQTTETPDEAIQLSKIEHEETSHLTYRNGDSLEIACECAIETENLDTNKKEESEGCLMYEDGDYLDIPCDCVIVEISQAETEKLENEKDEKSENLEEKPKDSNSCKLGDMTVEKSDEKTEYNAEYICHICNQVFVDLQNLIRHRRDHYYSESAVTCKLCKKTFNERSTYRSHMEMHEKSGDRAYSCDVCNKRFRQSTHLKVHMHLHSGKRPFSCIICGKRFITKSHLKIHTRSKHTGERPYGCEYCNRRFVQKSELVVHLRFHTGERPYTCLVCGKAFARGGHLTTHALKVHSLKKKKSGS